MDLEYNGILLTEENIVKLAQEGKIDRNFPYLNNTSIMIPAIVVKPELLKICDRTILFVLDSKIFNQPFSDEVKKECLYQVIERLRSLSYTTDYLFEDTDFLIKIATKDIDSLVKLIDRFGRKKENILKEIFCKHYEDRYIYNPDYEIPYALSNSKCLLNTLKTNSRYYIDKFSLEAYSDEVIDYIIEKKFYGTSHLSKMYQIPRITIAKLKEDIDFFYRLDASAINEDVVEFLKSINFKVDYTRLKENTISPDFLLFLLKEDIGNIKFLKDYRSIDKKIVDYLVSVNYVFKKGDNELLLTFDEIVKSTVINGNLDYIVMNNVELNDSLSDFVMSYIKETNYDIKTIRNKSLLKREDFNNYLKNKYQVKNRFNLEDRHLYSNVSRSIDDDFIKYFSLDTTNVIIDQIVLNNYYINLEGIFKNMPVSKFYSLYQLLQKHECKFANNFDFYHFIKITKYFENNLSLLHELNQVELNDGLINNLILAINNQDKLENHKDLLLYKENYKKKIVESELDLQDKICYLLINGNRLDAANLINNVINVENAIYLQLEFSPESKEYQYLESCIELIKVLTNILETNDVNVLNNIFQNIALKYDMNVLTNKDALFENIKRIYGMVYAKESINPDKLREKGKLEEIDGVYIYHLEGEDFNLFSHRQDFNQEDKYLVGGIGELFSDFDRENPKFANYVCTTYESKYSQCNLTLDGTVIYELKDIANLMAFGNNDIFIEHLDKPLFKANSSFVNPIDMSYLGKGTYTPTEFDFVRKNHHNQFVTPGFIVCSDEKNITKYLSSAKNFNMGIVMFNPKKNLEYLKNEYLYYIENIDKLNYKEIYKLIGLTKGYAKEFVMDNELEEAIVKRCDELSDKERYLIMKTLEKYGYNKSITDDKQDNRKK